MAFPIIGSYSYYDAVNFININFTTVGTIATITGYTPDAGITTFNLNIPSQIYATATPATTYTVTSIGDYAFDRSASSAAVKEYMQILTIPSSVTNIGIKSFYDNRLMKCDFSNTYIERFGNSAFVSCINITTYTNGLVTLSNVCYYIDSDAFLNCNITGLIIKNGAATTLDLYTGAFGHNKLLNIQIYPRTRITLSGNYHFYGGLVSHTYFILPTGLTDLSTASWVFTQNISLTVFFSSTTLPIMTSNTFAKSDTDNSNVSFYYLENTTNLTNLTTMYPNNTKTGLKMISSYNFYAKDTDTVISSPILLSQAVDFKIVFVNAQASFNSGTDITVSNGVLSTMTATNATNLVYKGTFTPTSSIISTTGNNLNICANKYAIRDTIFGWAHLSSTTSLMSYSIDTINTITPFLSSISFPNGDGSLSPTFSLDTYNYIATNVATIPYTVTLTPTAYSSSSTITANGNLVTSGSPINLVFSISSINTITIVVNGSTTRTYIVTFPSLLSKSTTVLSAFNTANSTSTQRFQTNLDNTTLTSPIVQYVQDISQNALGYTSNAVNQRFIFGSALLSNPLELNSTVNAAGTEISSNVKANNFLAYSDVRLKKNIEGLTELQGIDNIRVVQYNNKSDDSKHFGVIAHELAEIYPELVDGEKNGESMQSVAYLELIPICINEIQLLKKQAALLDAI